MAARIRIAENAPLQARNGFRIAARAELLARVDSAAAVADLCALPFVRQFGLVILGEGSNTLLVGDVPGMVVSVDIRGREVLEDGPAGARLRIGAGESWDGTVRWSLALGLAGLENLALIPGTAGAAPIQNIGAYGTQIEEFIAIVEAWDRATGQLVRLDRGQCAFGYRDSVFKRQPGRWVVTAIELELPRRREPRINYPGLPEELATLGAGPLPTPHQIAEAVIRLRTRKLPDPQLLPNLGSFFRNPIVAGSLADRLRARMPGMPLWPADGQRKLSAAWLIERAGWKGFRDGDAGVSPQHALVLVNHGRADGGQMLGLARRVAGSVHEQFGLWLEPEARIVGAEWPAAPAR